jgi:H+/gluconate symporter-like permease
MDAFAGPVSRQAPEMGIEPALLHRVAALSSGSVDSLPHNGSVVTILSVCGKSHQESYRDVAVVLVAGPILALIVVLIPGATIGTF